MERTQQGHRDTPVQQSIGLQEKRIKKADETKQGGRRWRGKELKQKEHLAVCQQRQPQLAAIW